LNSNPTLDNATTIEKGNKGSMERLDFLKLPRPQNILTKDYLERSCNFINPKNIKNKNLNRLVVLICKTIIFKKMLSITYWLFIYQVQLKRKKFKNMNQKSLEKIENMKTQLENLLHQKYFLLLARLRHPKDTILELLPFLFAKSILLIYYEKYNDSLEEIFGIFGFNSESYLFVYQYVLSLFN